MRVALPAETTHRRASGVLRRLDGPECQFADAKVPELGIDSLDRALRKSRLQCFRIACLDGPSSWNTVGSNGPGGSDYDGLPGGSRETAGFDDDTGQSSAGPILHELKRQCLPGVVATLKRPRPKRFVDENVLHDGVLVQVHLNEQGRDGRVCGRR